MKKLNSLDLCMHSTDRRSCRDQRRAHSVRTSRRDSDRSRLAVRERRALWREYERSFGLLCVVIAAISDFYSSLAITNMGKGHCSPKMRERILWIESHFASYFRVRMQWSHQKVRKKSLNFSSSATIDDKMQLRRVYSYCWSFEYRGLLQIWVYFFTFFIFLWNEHTLHKLRRWEIQKNIAHSLIRSDDRIGYSEFLHCREESNWLRNFCMVMKSQRPESSHWGCEIVLIK